MPEYLVSQDTIARVTPETWLNRYWLAVRTLRGDDTGLSRAEAESYLQDQAIGNATAAIRRRCWMALERYGISGVSSEAGRAGDENQGR